MCKKAKKLRHEERWNKVFINPDLTVKERKIHLELRQQLKQRKENGERNLIIDRGRIVHSNKKSSNPDSFLGGGNRCIVPQMIIAKCAYH